VVYLSFAEFLVAFRFSVKMTPLLLNKPDIYVNKPDILDVIERKPTGRPKGNDISAPFQGNKNK
jgi:hypothetical protein